MPVNSHSERRLAWTAQITNTDGLMAQHTLEFNAIGTGWRIGTGRPLPPGVVDQITSRVEAFDATYSRFRPDSLVSSLRSHPGRTPFPEDAGPLFALYRRLYDATGGAVSPLVGQAPSTWGTTPTTRCAAHPGRCTSPPGTTC